MTSTPSPDARLRLLPGGRIGVPSWAEWARTLLGATLFFGPGAWWLRFLGRRGRRPALHRFERAWARYLVRFLRIDLRLGGLENIDAGERYVVVSLHEGFADAVALLHLPLDLRFVARDELFEWPTLGRYLRDTDQLLVTTNQPISSYRRLLRSAGEVFAAGESLVVFPQGTILGIESAFTQGGFRLAQRFDVPVLPVVLTGSHRVWEHPYTPLLRYGQQITLEVLPPIPSDRAVARARSLEREMKRRALDGAMTPPRRFDPSVDGFWDGYRYEIDADFADLAAVVEAHRRRRQ